MAEKRGKAQLLAAVVKGDVFIQRLVPLLVDHRHKGLTAGGDRGHLATLIEGQRKRIEHPIIFGFTELARGFHPLDKIGPEFALVILGVAAVALRDAPGMTGIALHPFVSDDGVFRGPGDHLAFPQLAISLALQPDLTVGHKNIGIFAPFAGQDHLIPLLHGVLIMGRFAQDLVIFPADRFAPRPLPG